jgi:hypothetical protein
MVDMHADTDLVVISTVGGIESTNLEYDGEGMDVQIWERFVGDAWKKVNLIDRTGAGTAEEAEEAERRGRFRTKDMRAGEVLQFGLLPSNLPTLDPNSPGFRVEQFEAFVTIVAILAGTNETGWIVDQGSSVGGTFYFRRIITGSLGSTGPRITTMRLEIGQERPFRSPATGIWHLPDPKQILVSPSTTDHRFEVLGLLPGHHYFATILLIDDKGRWSSFQEDFTTLRRKVTVSFKRLEIVDDGDDGDNTGEAEFKFLILRGRFAGGLGTSTVKTVAEFPYDHGNISDKKNERYIDLGPKDFTHVMGPEKVMSEDHDVVIWIRGNEDDTHGGSWFFSLFESDEPAWGIKPLPLPTGLGLEQVIDRPFTVYAKPAAVNCTFAFTTTAMYSIEYTA